MAPSGRVLEEGEGEARVLGGALTVTPESGQLLRLRAGDVVEIGEPQPYVVRLVLAEGRTLELSRLGPLRTQLLSDFGTVRKADTSVLVTAFVVLPAERAIVHEVLNDGGCDTYVYDIGAGGAVEAVHTIAAGLALIGYRLDVLDADVNSAASSYPAAARLPHVAELRTRLRGRAAHGDQWHPQLAALLN